MTDFDNTNSFVLFKNDKEGNDKRPDYTGTLTLENGEEKQLAAWIREGKNGKFMSGKVSEPYKKEPAPVDSYAGPEDDDLIPF